MRRLVFFVVFFLCSVVALISPGYALTLTDGWGRTVEFDRPVERIVSLSPANTEIVYFLELDRWLVGVTSYCNYPPEVSGKEQVGSLIEVDLERVVSLQPDVILAGSLTAGEVVERLASFGLKVFVLDPKTVEDVLEAMMEVARMAGIEFESREKMEDLASRLKSVTGFTGAVPEAERPDVLHLIWHDPIWTVGQGTFVHQYIQAAGGRNLTGDLSGYVTLELEELLRRNPSIITVVGHHGGVENLPYQFITTDPRLRGIRAVQEGRVYRVDSDIVSRTGPRVAQAVMIFARIFYPETFGHYDQTLAE